MVLCQVDTVSVELPEPVTDEGEKLTDECGSDELALSATVPVNPFSAPTETTYEVPDPAVTVWLDGNADNVKFPEGDVDPTTSVSGSVCVRLPLVAVSVSV